MAYRDRARPGRPTGAKRVIAWIFLVVLGIVFLIGPPVAIVYGVNDIHHADQIRADGVTTTATVTSDVQDTKLNAATPCWGAQVSYVTAGGAPESAELNDRANCLAVGSQVRVVYDPSAPNVIQPPGDRGSTTGGWGKIIMGGLFTALFWGVTIWSFVKQRRSGGRGTRLTRRAGALAQPPL